MSLPIQLGATSGSPSGYNIQRSLRFRSSASAYLSRTPASVGNRRTWTLSQWMKRGALSAAMVPFGAGSVGNEFTLDWRGFDALDFYDQTSSTNNAAMTTNAVYRDPSAWYHILFAWDTTQATASDRWKLYINGVQITSFSATQYPAQNYQGYVNNTVAHYIGIRAGSTTPFDGYLAEVNFIDGQALTPSSFGQTDPVTGVWQPKKYTGTYGTNGFYLDFKDNTSAATLAYDKSGNGNNWTANNISTTAGATYDSMTDVPTLTSATAANFETLNPINSSQSGLATGGNLDVSIAAGATGLTGTFGVTSGKWYWEFNAGSAASNSYYVSICDLNSWFPQGKTQTDMYNSANIWTYYGTNGNKITAATSTAYGASFTNGDVIGVALDMDAGTVTFYKNNTSQGQAYSGLTGKSIAPWIGNGSGSNSIVGACNFGQRPFSYTPPTGFKALNTFNLPDPTIKKPNQYMDATTYTGNGNPNNTTQTITNSGSMQPDFVWIKSRSNAYNNSLFDSVRGVANTLASNSTAAEDTTGTTMLTSLNSNGFTVGSNLNGSLGSTNVNGATYVGWQWKKGATPGFDIVTYTGTGVNRTVAHNLGVAPKMMIIKNRVTATWWDTYHSALGATKYLRLNDTTAAITGSLPWNNTEPTSSVFTVGTVNDVNANGDTYVAYLFAEIPGFSKFGSYTGNGSADGPFVYCGFRPKYVIRKRTDSTGSWLAQDSARPGYNANINYTSVLYTNTSSDETIYNEIDIISNGFKIRANDTFGNANGGTYIYAAFAENPFKYSNAR